MPSRGGHCDSRRRQFCRTDSKCVPKGQSVKMKGHAVEYFDKMECVTVHLVIVVWGLFLYPFIL